MRLGDFNITPYSTKYENELMKLETRSPQGHWIKLEMIRDHFLSRSDVFEDYQVFQSHSEDGILQGVAAASIVPFQHNQQIVMTGFGYDLKVAHEFRRLGLAKTFGIYLVEKYLNTKNIWEYFITAKTKNIGAAKAVWGVKRDWSEYNFVYLTIPTHKRINKIKLSGSAKPLKFTVRLFAQPDQYPDYFYHSPSGLGVWKTYKTYQIKISHMHPLVGGGISLLNLLFSKKNRKPTKDQVLKFATVFDLHPENLPHINEVLEDLEKREIQYLNVCCLQNDPVYQNLNSLSINVLKYSLLNTFSVKNGDNISVDVRCL